SFSIVQFSRSCAGRFSRTAYLLYLIEFRLSRTFLKIFLSCPAVRPALSRSGSASSKQLIYVTSSEAFCQELFRGFSLCLRRPVQGFPPGN
ncbi:hypothetical protein, partial [uncultured Gemmiger sp.]|uniref:hypothetical protein n=1 Tax=uncultured Gemmiger sp. TaxID=1623490 RepID=UPI0025E80F9D